MIDAVKNALANYQDYLEFEDEPTRIIIKLKKYTPKFGEIRPILEQGFNGEYHKFVDKEHQAFWVIQKGKDAAKPAEERNPVKPAPAPKKFAPSLPEDTMITVSYSRKVCPRQYESMGFSASVEVPIGLKDDAGLVVTDWVEEKLLKRLKELEQQ